MRDTLGSIPAVAVGIFPGRHTGDLKIGTSGFWRYKVRAGTGWPGVSILRLGERKFGPLFYLSVTARAIVWPAPSLKTDTLACRWDVKQPTNKKETLATARHMF